MCDRSWKSLTDIFATKASESFISSGSSITESAIAAWCTPACSNHVHLLIETGAVGLSKIMQGIQFSYTQRWQSRPKCWRGCLTRPCRSENPLDKL
jgi:hypothetical protein